MRRFEPGSSSISGILLTLGRTLEMKGINPGSLFRTLGLDIAHLNNPASRIPTSKTSKAWQLAAEKTQDPAIGITVCENIHAAVWYALSYVVFSSESILSALQRVVQYNRVIVTVAGTTLHESRDAFVLSWPGHPFVSKHGVDMYGGTIIQMCRHLTGSMFNPMQVSLTRELPPDGGRRHEEFYRAPVAFSEKRNAIHFSKEACEKTVLIGNEELLNRNEHLVQEYLRRVKGHEFINLVHSRVIELFSNGKVQEQKIAESMNLSQRSLQRKLNSYGTSFRHIVENARKGSAMELIDETDLRMSEIGFRLGYTDTGNFSSAFKRWTGVSPSQYRNRHKYLGSSE